MLQDLSSSTASPILFTASLRIEKKLSSLCVGNSFEHICKIADSIKPFLVRRAEQLGRDFQLDNPEVQKRTKSERNREKEYEVLTTVPKQTTVRGVAHARDSAHEMLAGRQLNWQDDREIKYKCNGDRVDRNFT